MMEELHGAEILELEDGERREVHVTEWELGILEISPRDGSGPKRIRVLRVSVPVVDKQLGPPYWDITGQTLIEQLLPYLKRPDFRRLTFGITKWGVAPQARFQLEVTP